MKAIFGPLGRRRSFRRLSDAKGANIVEAAVMTPLLLLLTFAIVDFSSMFYAYLALEHGVSQATRYAITGQAETGLTRVESIKKQMRDATPTLTIPDAAFSFSFMPATGGSWSAGTGGAGDIGRVQVTYTWQFLTPLIRPFFTNGQVVLTVQSTMKNEAVFN